MNRKLTALLALPFALVVQAEPAFYQGHIGDKIGISIEVDPSENMTPGAVVYDRTGADAISLEVTPGKPGG